MCITVFIYREAIIVTYNRFITKYCFKPLLSVLYSGHILSNFFNFSFVVYSCRETPGPDGEAHRPGTQASPTTLKRGNSLRQELFRHTFFPTNSGGKCMRMPIHLTQISAGFNRT